MRVWTRMVFALMALTGILLNSLSQAREPEHRVIASSFADPRDVADYRRCVAQGRQGCLAIGDNGIGLWGDDTTREDTPGCALPQGVWRSKWGGGGAAQRTPLIVTYRSYQVTCLLLDTLPAHPRHHVGLDLNPGSAKALGLKPPFLVPGVEWRWKE